LSHRWWESWKLFVTTKSIIQEDNRKPSIIEEEEDDFDEIVQNYLINIQPFNAIQNQLTRNVSMKKTRRSIGTRTHRDGSIAFEDNKDSIVQQSKYESGSLPKFKKK